MCLSVLYVRVYVFVCRCVRVCAEESEQVSEQIDISNARKYL